MKRKERQHYTKGFQRTMGHQSVLHRALICIALAMMAMPCMSQNWQDIYKKLSGLSSSELLERGHRCAEITYHPDSAMICYTIVVNRYSEKMTDSELRNVSKAYIGRWYLYFFSYFDYAKAFENLSKAREIGFRINRDKARILLNFGCMYQTIAEQNHNRELCRKAYGYYREAYHQGIAESDTSSTMMSFGNLLYVAYSLDSLQSIASDFAFFQKMRGDIRIDYNKMLYYGLLDMGKGLFDRAFHTFARQQKIVEGRQGYERYVYLSLINQSRSLICMKRYDQAEELMERVEHYAEGYDMKDAKLEVYSTMAELYKESGNEEMSLHYRDKYFQLKDTLMNYQQVASVSQFHFLNEIKQLDEQLAKTNQQRRIQAIIATVAVAVAVLLMLFILVISGKNKQLRKKNKALYERSQEILSQPIETALPAKKYQNSTLDDSEKDSILERILHVMDTSDEIFSPDFNVERLAQLTGSKSKQVSQVINEKYNDNFNALVNKYRIREACRRLSDRENYGMYTIDAISKSVGFRSRNTFAMGFRKFTGLTPSEYQRIAKEKEEQK